MATKSLTKILAGHSPVPMLVRLPSYTPMEDVEPFDRYRPGGYYPVQIGDRLCSSRYHIVHKLGYGTYSTIWLARDEHLAKYVAIKFVISQVEPPYESAILRHLWEEKDSTFEPSDGLVPIPEVLDEFEVEGPEIQGARSTHHCLVTTPARMSIAEAREASFKCLFQPIVARAIAAQLIQAVASLHSRGIIHGDLHEGNILLRLPDTIDGLTTDELYQKYGPPALAKASRLDGSPLDDWMPTHGVSPIWMGKASEKITLGEARIILNDFGESFQPAIEPRSTSNAPTELRPPEAFLEPRVQLSFSAEIWSLACIVFAVMGQRLPVEPWSPAKDEVLAQPVDAPNYLPDEWWISPVDCDQDLDAQVQATDGGPRQLLEDQLEDLIQKPRRKYGMAEMDDEEEQAFLSLMRSMLKFRPEDRLSAQQVLKSRWMQNWAKPAFESMENLLRN